MTDKHKPKAVPRRTFHRTSGADKVIEPKDAPNKKPGGK